jgi:glyoxylase-like metal-dependent hydrolase (beta-lactamase superfamily II)
MPNGTYPMDTNAVLWEVNGSAILFDAADGDKLLPNLEARGVKSSDVLTIFITHMHGDHIGGLVINGTRTFPNATVYIAQNDVDYYTIHNTSTILAVFSLYSGDIKTFNPTTDGITFPDVPGVLAVEAYGHTPGHTVYLVDGLLIWGDLTHAMAVQMPHPEIAVTYDVDPHEAVRKRAEILQKIVQHKWGVAGMHIPFPGMGNLTRSNPGYTFLPFDVPWPSPKPEKGTMPGWQIAVIVVGACVVAAASLAIGLYCFRRSDHEGMVRMVDYK